MLISNTDTPCINSAVIALSEIYQFLKCDEFAFISMMHSLKH